MITAPAPPDVVKSFYAGMKTLTSRGLFLQDNEQIIRLLTMTPEATRSGRGDRKLVNEAGVMPKFVYSG